MMIMSFRGLGNSIKDKTLLTNRLPHYTLDYVERNVRIFYDKWRMEEMLWDLLHFYSSL